MVERWTRERRMEHTRALLIDAAEATFAAKGFVAATLGDIADVAGYTKGAIYAHFDTKESLFLAVSDRYWRRYFDNFTDVLSTVTHIGDAEIDEIAARWRHISESGGAQHAALGHEFTLYLLRNPEALERVAERRLQVLAALTTFVIEGVARLGATLSIPAETFAQLLISTSDGVMLGSQLTDLDLYRPALQMYMSVIEMPPSSA
ncbi:TetR/AcrR family transcriptional regulator [soil metagenome]